MKKNVFITANGFTLIELVVVIGMLTILAIFLIATLNPIQQFEKARDAGRKSDLTQIKRALEQYYQDHGNYPASNASYQMTDFNGNPVVWGGSAGWTPYMTLVPKDPSSDRKYLYYAVDNNGNSGPGTTPQKYYLFAALERGPEDPQTCMAASTQCKANPTSQSYCNCPNVPAGSNCGIGVTYPCNFGLSSPNTSP